MKFALREENKTWSPIEREKNTVRIHIDIDTICNQKCVYCYSRQEKQNWGLLLPNNYIDNILFPKLEEISKQTFLDVNILGGEPTLHPRFNDVLTFVTSLPNTRISITSNGTNGYKNNQSSDRIRWAFTYHPSEVKNIDKWIAPILERKDEWWEVAISPLIDCWGSEKVILENANKVKKVISICNENGIKVQPTFQFNPYAEGEPHIDMTLVEKYYPFLEDEYPIYVYGNTFLNDYTILKEKKNFLKGCTCVNNNFNLTVRGTLVQCCTNKNVTWDDLVELDKVMTCPLNECTCYGFLSIHKEV